MASVKKKKPVILLKSRSVGMTSMSSAIALFFAKANSSAKDDIDDSMGLSLEKVKPQFRQLVDQLFFSDRMDLDLSEFKNLLRENYEIHHNYLWDRFQKGISICWEDGSEFWAHRLGFLVSLNDKALSRRMDGVLEKRMFDVVRIKHELNIAYDIEYLQFLEFCKIKFARKEELVSTKTYFTEITGSIGADKLIKIVESFIPIVFSSMEEYVDCITKKIPLSSRNFDLLLALEKRGVQFNRAPIIHLAKSILLERLHTEKNRRAFFTVLADPSVRELFKQEYKLEYRDKLSHLIDSCDYLMLEEQHLRNIKNIIDLDEGMADSLAVIYAEKLYQRSTGHKKANADRLIRLLNQCPQISPKKILAWLSANNKMNDIKYILNSFPNLKKLAAFM